MKVRTFCWVVLVGLLSGCNTRTPLLVPGTVGPETAIPVPVPPTGRLIVFSAEEVGPTSATAFDDVFHCSDYDIFGQDGRRLQRVANFADRFSTTPATVELPPGTYRVVARANRFGLVAVNVEIVSRKTTVVHLDGNWRPRTADPLVTANTVRLPDGRVVGWRSAASSSLPAVP